MELNNKKIKAISLIELMICFIMAGIFMLIIFGVVSKTVKSEQEYEAGIFYCWKDWNGTLYQKKPLDNIEQVSSCKISIPKNAKNAKVIIIGGGSGGYDYDKNSLLNMEQDYIDIEKPNTICLKPNSPQKKLYPYTSILIDSSQYTIEYICDSDDKGCIHKPQLEEAGFNTENSEIFTGKFFKELYIQGKCYLPIISNGNSKYINPKKSGNHFYYNPEIKTGTQCYARTRNFGVKQGTCYENAYFFIDNEEYTNLNSADLTNINRGKPNVLRYSQIKPQKQFEIYKSTPGKITSGNIMTGKEYEIPADAIGEGGEGGKSGTITKFSDLIAESGVISNEKYTLTVKTNTPIYNNIENLKNKRETMSVCKSSNTECHGILNSSLLSGYGIQTSNEATIKVSEFNNKLGKWDKSKNPQYSTDEIEKTGFGYFGASGTAKNCQIKYYPIKRLGYNDRSDYSIINSKAEITCEPAGHGMGGAIVIKWD